MSELHLYTGLGHRDPRAGDRLPTVDPTALRAPEDYRATTRTAAAVEVALTLGMPLLVTGEPGSGKSGLAASIAWELGLGEVLRFPVKSDTESRDLFYCFLPLRYAGAFPCRQYPEGRRSRHRPRPLHHLRASGPRHPVGQAEGCGR